MTYKYEFLNGTKSDLLKQFAKKYPQKKIEEKGELQNDIKNVKDFSDFLSGLQILIFYLNKENFDIQKSISDVISSLPKYISINEECKLFFKTNNKFTIEVLLGIYENFEYLCFEKIKLKVKEHQQQMKQESIDKVNDYYNQNNQHRLITKAILASGVRKFISRYLCGIRNDVQVQDNENIFLFLPYKLDLWSKEIADNPKFMEEFKNMQELDIKNNEAINLYEILGGDKAEDL